MAKVNAVSKKVKKAFKAHKAAATAVTTTSAEAKAKVSKANADTTAQPGVISTIMTLLTKAKASKKPVTSGELLDSLAKAFPDRKREGMIITVRAQLSRLPNEKDFAITKVRDGRVVRYAAA
jgi:hypothetical protein